MEYQTRNGEKPKRFSCLSEKQLMREWSGREVIGLIDCQDLPKLKDVLYEFPELANEEGNYHSILYQAVHKGHLPTLEVLFNTKGFDFLRRHYYGQTQYHTAPLEILQVMVEKYPLGIHVLDGKLNSPLHYACKENEQEKVDFLLQQPSININIENDSGELAEELTTSQEIKQLFCVYKEKVNIQQELEAEQNALSKESEDLSSEELQKEWTFYDLWEMLLEKRFSKLKAIFKHKPELIDLCDGSENSFLHTAVLHKYSPNVIKFLMEYGVDDSALNVFGQSAYHIAVNSPSELKILVKNNRNGLNTMNDVWKTPIHLICEMEFIELLTSFLKYPGVRVDAKNKKGQKPGDTTDNNIIQFMLSKYLETGSTGVSLVPEEVEKEIMGGQQDKQRAEKEKRKKQGKKENKKTSSTERYSILTEEQLNGNWDFSVVKDLLVNEDVPKLRDLFNTQPNLVNLSSSYEGALIEVAVSGEMIPMVKLLIEYDVDLSNRKIFVRALKSKECFQLLAEANPEIWDETSFFHTVCNEQEEYADTVEYILQHDAGSINALESYYWDTPLHSACKRGHTNIVNLLLHQPNIDVNVKNKTGLLPEETTEDTSIKKLVSAKRESGVNLDDWMKEERERYSMLSSEELRMKFDSSVIEDLIDNKDYRKLKDIFDAQPTLMDIAPRYGDSTPTVYRVAIANKKLSLSGIDFLFQKGNESFAKRVYDYDQYAKIFNSVIGDNDLDSFKHCVEKIPNGINSLGCLTTPLHMACSRDSEFIIKYLLEQPGINVNTVDGNLNLPEDCTENTILKAMIRNYRKDENSSVIKKGALISFDKDQVDKDWSFQELLTLLVDRQEDALKAIFAENQELVNAKNENEDTLLHFAVAMKLPDCARFLLQQGANSKSRNRHVENTPFHVGARFKENLAVLLEHDPSGVNLPNEKWNTPLHIACVNGAVESAEFLLQQKNVRVNAKNKAGKTVSDVTEDAEVKKLLTSYLVKTATHQEV